MIRLSRSELLKLATVALAANTPRSLYQGLLRTEAVARLKTEATQAELCAYFDRITARARRSEIDIALAYSVLLGILLNQRAQDAAVPPNLERLHWGPAFEKMASAEPTDQTVEIKSNRSALIRAESTPSSRIILPSGIASRWEANS